MSDVTLSIRGTLRGMRRLWAMAVLALPFGIGFGAAAVERGLAASEAVLMSLLVFSGTAQFAALELWQPPVPLLSLALVALAVNARLAVMSAALAPWLNPLPRGRWFLALCLLSDPNFADSQPAFRAGERDVGVLLGGGLVLWLVWTAGTAVGAFAGAIAADLEALGFDVLMLAFFVAVLADQCRDRTAWLPAFAAAAVAVATSSVLSTGWNVIAGAAAGTVVAALRGNDA